MVPAEIAALNVVVETLFLQFAICAGDNSRPPLKGWVYLVGRKHNPSCSWAFTPMLSPDLPQGAHSGRSFPSSFCISPTFCFTLSGTPAPDSKLTLTLSSGSQIRKERKWVPQFKFSGHQCRHSDTSLSAYSLVTLSGGREERDNWDGFGEQDTAVSRRDPGQRAAHFLVSGEFMKSHESDIPGCG